MFLHCGIQGQVAQLVEQRTENPCVTGSIPVLTRQSKLTHLHVVIVAQSVGLTKKLTPFFDYVTYDV
jgi:hypothetical protein